MRTFTSVLLIVILVGLVCGLTMAGTPAGDEEGEEQGETVAYLGVLTREADPTLRRQLGLPRGIGLVVTYVAPDSGAADVLQQDDLLLRLNDQALVNSQQFAVLVQTNQSGRTVELERIRAGDRHVAQVVLGAKVVNPRALFGGWPRQSVPFDSPTIRPFSFSGLPSEGAQRLHEEMSETMARMREALGARKIDEAGRAEALRHLSNVFFRARQAIHPTAGARLRAISTDASATLVEDGETLTLKDVDDDGTHLTVKDQAGNVLFEGPVGTAEERARVPLQYRARLEKLKELNARILGPSGGADNPPLP